MCGVLWSVCGDMWKIVEMEFNVCADNERVVWKCGDSLKDSLHVMVSGQALGSMPGSWRGWEGVRVFVPVSFNDMSVETRASSL